VNPQLAAISQIAVTTETECLKLPNKTEKDCEKAKNDAIVDTIKGLCKEDKACIQAIADGLKNGTVPLSAPGIDPTNKLDNVLINDKDLPKPNDFIKAVQFLIPRFADLNISKLKPNASLPNEDAAIK